MLRAGAGAWGRRRLDGAGGCAGEVVVKGGRTGGAGVLGVAGFNGRGL